MKRTLLCFILGAGLVGAMATSAVALTINFASVGDANITFIGTGDTFTFNDSTVNPTGFDFQVGTVTGQTDSDTDGLLGKIAGTFTIGAISSPTPGLETAPVSGTGTLSVRDENGQTFSAILSWVSISTFGTSGAVNALGAVNLSGISYAGANADLLAFLGPPAVGVATANFTFVPAKSLTELTTDDAVNTTTHSGSFAPIPEPTSLLLLGVGLFGIAFGQRKVVRGWLN